MLKVRAVFKYCAIYVHCLLKSEHLHWGLTWFYVVCNCSCYTRWCSEVVIMVLHFRVHPPLNIPCVAMRVVHAGG